MGLSNRTSTTSTPRTATEANNTRQNITGCAMMTSGQKIDLLRAVTRLREDYLRCAHGDTRGESLFWLKCTNVVLEEHGLEFSSRSTLKGAVKTACNLRLKQMATGTLQPNSDDLSRAIDEWNEIELQRERAHVAQREAAGLAMRWAKVPQEIRALSQRKLEEHWRTMEDPASNAEELNAASLRIAILLSPDSPQLTQKFADKVTSQMELRRRDAENLAQGASSGAFVPTARSGSTDKAESGASTHGQASGYRLSTTSMPLPATSSGLASQDSTPQPLETPSPSRMGKREAEPAPAINERAKKKRKKSSRHKTSVEDGRKSPGSAPSGNEGWENPELILPSVERSRGAGDLPAGRELKRHRAILLDSSSPCQSSSATPATHINRGEFPAVTPSRSSTSRHRSQSGTVQTASRGGHSRLSTIPGASQSGRSRARASTSPPSPPTSPLSTVSDESSDSRFNRAQTDYDVEPVRSIVQRHMEVTKEKCKQLKKDYNRMGRKSNKFDGRLAELEYAVRRLGNDA